ncbi:hypothetical protein EES44_14325 [Streptomyces sp. ADI96-15]|nr:hypothetical protein EES44_14325 [Streptomyces sp. ADI96-15]
MRFRSASPRQTSPTDIGCERLQHRHGYRLNWYDTQGGSALTEWPGTGKPVHPFPSSLHNVRASRRWSGCRGSVRTLVADRREADGAGCAVLADPEGSESLRAARRIRPGHLGVSSGCAPGPRL